MRRLRRATVTSEKRHGRRERQTAAKQYAVKQVRGPFVHLLPHPEAVDHEDELPSLVARLREQHPGVLVGADLFCGAGGLSLGLERAGVRTVLAIDRQADAVETARHHLPGLATTWDLADPDVVDRVGNLLAGLEVDVLAGGPPCQPFSKAGRSRIRHEVLHRDRDAHDSRRDLWQSFFRVARLARPRAVVMENVPDMVLDREMFILRVLVHELEELGYSVRTRVVDTWRHGVPQFRQRLVLVAMRDGAQFKWPVESETRTTVDNAIGDLPAVEGGWRPPGGAQGWANYDPSAASTTFQRQMRASVPGPDRRRLYDHITRPVRDDDLAAFALMGPGTRYSELPEDMRRYRDDIFDDKYKRLNPDDLSRTITAHIAKDGYWYIHPYQDRTITVREAARLQTFPDDFRFAGPPSSAFRQIGNAVPPLLGQAVGAAVASALSQPPTTALSTAQVSGLLAQWFRTTARTTAPWLRSGNRWLVIAGELLLADKVPEEHVRHVWPMLERWDAPKTLLDHAEELTAVSGWVGRHTSGERLLRAATVLSVQDGLDEQSLAAAVTAGALHRSVANLALLAVPEDDGVGEEPIITNRGVLRVAARFSGQSVDVRNKLTDGRMAVASMVGYGPDSRAAHLALMDLAASLCRPEVRECTLCPLSLVCAGSHARAQRASQLPLGELS